MFTQATSSRSSARSGSAASWIGMHRQPVSGEFRPDSDVEASFQRIFGSTRRLSFGGSRSVAESFQELGSAANPARFLKKHNISNA